MPRDYGIAGHRGEAPPSSVTTPVYYSGKYYDRELRFDESIYGLCPPPCEIRPSNILVFELFDVSPSKQSGNTAAAWAVLPMCDQHFRVTHGKFRIPFLRGPIDRSINKFETIEKRYANDLNMWLANLYIDIKVRALLMRKMPESATRVHQLITRDSSSAAAVAAVFVCFSTFPENFTKKKRTSGLTSSTLSSTSSTVS